MLRPAGIGEAQVLRLHSTQDLEGGLLFACLLRFFGKDFTQPFGGSVGLLHLADDFGEGSQRGAHKDTEENEAHELLAGDVAPGQHPGPEPGHHRDGPEEDKDDEGEKGRPHPRPLDHHSKIVPQGRLVALFLVGFVVVGFQLGDSLGALLHHHAAGGQAVLRRTRITPHLSPEECHGQHHHRNHGQHEERQFPRKDEDENETAHQDHGLASQLRNGCQQGLTQHRQVCRHPAAQLPGPVLVKELHPQADQPTKNVAPDVIESALTGLDEAAHPPVGDEGLEGEDT